MHCMPGGLNQRPWHMTALEGYARKRSLQCSISFAAERCLPGNATRCSPRQCMWAYDARVCSSRGPRKCDPLAQVRGKRQHMNTLANQRMAVVNSELLLEMVALGVVQCKRPGCSRWNSEDDAAVGRKPLNVDPWETRSGFACAFPRATIWSLEWASPLSNSARALAAVGPMCYAGSTSSVAATPWHSCDTRTVRIFFA